MFDNKVDRGLADIRQECNGSIPRSICMNVIIHMKIFLWKNIYLFEKAEIERQSRDLPSTGSHPGWLQWRVGPVQCQESGASYKFPMWVQGHTNRKLDQKLYSRDLNQCPYGMPTLLEVALHATPQCQLLRIFLYWLEGKREFPEVLEYKGGWCGHCDPWPFPQTEHAFSCFWPSSLVYWSTT